MLMQLAIYLPTGGAPLADWSTRTVSCHVRTGAHGYESCEAEIRIPFYEAFLYYQQFGPLVLRVLWGDYKVWEGRLEDPTQFTATVSGLKITAFGAWVALNDTTYVALWGDKQLTLWRLVLGSEVAARTPDLYGFTSNSNQLALTLQKNTVYVNNASIGTVCYLIPDQSTRNIVGMSFDLEVLLPLNWKVETYRWTAGFGAATNITTMNASGIVQRTTINVTFTGAPIVTFDVYNASGASPAFAGENGADYVRITNVQLVTSTTNRINTTLGTIIAAGTRTVTPASMTGVYVGQRLNISQGSLTVGESIVVTAITATTFTAVFAFAHVAADTVTAHVIYPDEIIKDIAATISTLNSTQFSIDVTNIQSQGIDIDQAIFEDVVCTDVVNQMLAKSDTQARQWVGLVYNDQKMIARPRGSGTAWYVDAATLEIVRTLTTLYNSVYGVYNEVSNNRKLRTAVSSDTASISKFSITRRTSISVNTTSLIQAQNVRNTLLATQLDPIPRASITIHKIFDQYGTPYPLYFMRSDDTITLRNLPPTLGQAYDKIRTLVVTHTDYDLVTNRITLELELPLPDQSILLARALTS